MAYKHKEDKQADDKRYRQTESPHSKLRGARWNKENPEKSAINSISRVYNVDKLSAKNLYQKSITACDSCLVTWDLQQHKIRFCIDHNHSTGEVRGVLCNSCNSALGLLEEDDSKILALLAYNRKHNG